MQLLAYPIIHKNRSGYESLREQLCKESLREQLCKEYGIIQEAIEILSKYSPHGCDYYVSNDPEYFKTARDQHDARLTMLNKIKDELLFIAMKVVDQEK